MADVLPEDIRTRRRKAYMDPALARMVIASGGFAQFEDLKARVRRLADLGLVEPKVFRKHFDRMSARPIDGVLVERLARARGGRVLASTRRGMGVVTAPWIARVTWQTSVSLEDRSFRWGRLGADYVGQWNGLVVARVGVDGHVKLIVPEPGASSDIVEKATKGEVAAFARSLAGGLSLRCVRGRPQRTRDCADWSERSGQVDDGVAFALDSFRGELLADDVAGLDKGDGKMRVEPSELCIWLEEGKGEKAAVRPRLATAAAELGAIISLRLEADAGQPVLTRVRGAGLLQCVLDAVLRFDVSPEPRRREFDGLVELAIAAPMWQLVRSRRASPMQVAELIASVAQPTVVGCSGASA